MDKSSIYIVVVCVLCLTVSVSGRKHHKRDHRLKYQIDDEDENDFTVNKDNAQGENIGESYDKRDKKAEVSWKHMPEYDKTDAVLCENLKCRKHQMCLVNKEKGKAKCVTKKRALRERRKSMKRQNGETLHADTRRHDDNDDDDDHHDEDDDHHDDFNYVGSHKKHYNDDDKHRDGDKKDNRDEKQHYHDDDNDIEDDDDEHNEEITLDSNDIVPSTLKDKYSEGHYVRMTDEDLHKRNKELKEQLRAYNRRRKEHSDRKFKEITDKLRHERTNEVAFESDAVSEVKKVVTKPPPTCSGKELAAMGRRLLDWFKIIQDREKTGHKQKRNSIKKDLRQKDECICQGPVSNQFTILDSDNDNNLDLTELHDLEHSGYEHCVEPFLDLCDLDKDKILSDKEWCCCFADILPPCIEAQKYVPSTEANGKVYITPGVFVPECDSDGFFRSTQCHSSVGQCWCVDRNGVEIEGTRTRGMPECEPSETLQLE